MSKFLIVQKHGRPSTKKVFSYMNSVDVTMLHKRTLPNNVYYRKYVKGKINFEKIRSFSPMKNDVIIRWGNRIPYENTGYISYNSITAQNKAHNKKLSRQIMLEAGVNCPKLMTPDNYTNEIVIARPLSHSKGKNFIVLKNREDFVRHYNNNKNSWYYSEFIDKEAEFRVHCFLGKVLAVLQKPNPGDGQIAWNRSINEDPFILMDWSKVRKDVCLQALLACEALGVDISGVDVIWKDNKAYVLELNMAPTLNSSDHVAAKYAKGFDFIFRNTKNKRLKHWDFKKWQKRVSFFWKEFQLEASFQGDDVNVIVNNNENND